MQLTDNPLWSTRYKHELPPSPSPSPLLQTVIGVKRPFAYAEKISAQYGNRFTAHMVDMAPLVMLSDPHDIRAIATASGEILHGGGGGELMEPVFGASAFMLHEQDAHASVREAITPAFHSRTVRGHAGMIAEIVERELASWPAGASCALSPYVYRLTLTVMLMAAIATGEHVYEALCHRLLDMLSVMASPLLQEPRLCHLPGWRRTWRRFLRHRDEVDELVYGLISQRRKEGACGDLLGLLIAARYADGSPLSDEQVRDNLISTIVAGHETTAATLAWTFQLLAHNPAVQDRLIEEIDAGSDDSYLNAVIQEAIRHKPTFLFLPPRVVMRTIDIGGWSYRPPAQLLACTYLLHHDPELYSYPHAFTPERFLEHPPRPGTFLPWGLGRKRCPGRQFALIEIRAVLRRALSRWRVLPARAHIERPSWRTALLTPHAGSRVILRPRFSPRHAPLTAGKRLQFRT